MSRTAMIFAALREDMKRYKAQSAQLLLRSHNGPDGRYLVAHFTDVGNPKLRAKIIAITDKYCESLVKVRETKSTMSFMI